jgi:hypothetical protein
MTPKDGSTRWLDTAASGGGAAKSGAVALMGEMGRRRGQMLLGFVDLLLQGIRMVKACTHG